MRQGNNSENGNQPAPSTSHPNLGDGSQGCQAVAEAAKPDTPGLAGQADRAHGGRAAEARELLSVEWKSAGAGLQAVNGLWNNSPSLAGECLLLLINLCRVAIGNPPVEVH